MDVLAIVIGCAVSMAAAVPLYRVVFEDRDDFIDCLRLYFTPDIISLFRGEFWEDWRQSMKLGFYFLLVGALGVGTYFGIMQFAA